MLSREVVACLDLLPGDRLRRTFGTAVFPDFLVCRVTRGDKAGLRLADDTPERTTVRLSEIGLLLVLDLLPLAVGRVGRYLENYGRIPHGRRIGRRRGGGQSPCDQQRPDVGIASPEIPVQRGSRLGGAPLENVSPVGTGQLAAEYVAALPESFVGVFIVHLRPQIAVVARRISVAVEYVGEVGIPVARGDLRSVGSSVSDAPSV